MAESSDYFPVLEKLHLWNLLELERIPSVIGDIQTLRYLYVGFCSASAAISSTEMLEEQPNLENEDLHVKVSIGNSRQEHQSFV
ncbi:hypothetical protein ACS0TY_015417 [Phlomoides rotata]